MRLLRQIVKDHNVHRWIRSFLQAIPASSDNERRCRTAIRGRKLRPDKTERRYRSMPGVALVAAALRPARPRYEMGKGRQASRDGQRRRRRLGSSTPVTDYVRELVILIPTASPSSPATASPPGTPAETTRRTDRTPNSILSPVPRVRSRKARSNSWCARRCR